MDKLDVHRLNDVMLTAAINSRVHSSYYARDFIVVVMRLGGSRDFFLISRDLIYYACHVRLQICLLSDIMDENTVTY